MTQPSHFFDKRSLWILGWVSFCWSASSLMVFSILPTFLTEVLQLSKTKIGLIEGTANGMAFLSKVLTGILSDYWRVRKPLILLGTACTTLMKFIFALAPSAAWIWYARLLDRFGKGIRSAPTDALVADISGESKRGYAYGLRQALYTLGTVVGALLALGLMLWTHQNYRLIFALSASLGVVALIIIVFGLKPDASYAESSGHLNNSHWNWRHIRALPFSYWQTLLIVAVLMLAHFSEVFLCFQAQKMGWRAEWFPLLIILLNSFHAGVAYPLGSYSDRNSKSKVLFQGILCLLVADLFFLLGSGLFSCVVSIVLRGVHMGLTQGLLRSMLSRSVPYSLRGTAFSLFYIITGLSVSAGNLLAGKLSDLFGAQAPFSLSALCTLAALLLILFLGRWRAASA